MSALPAEKLCWAPVECGTARTLCETARDPGGMESLLNEITMVEKQRIRGCFFILGYQLLEKGRGRGGSE